MAIVTNFDLTAYNTFGVKVAAAYFAEVSRTDELTDILERFAGNPVLPIGGGSNLLFTRDVEGLVLKNNFKGMHVVAEDEAFVYLRIGAGEIWHHVVLYCVEKGWGGIENLSLIPGLAGAAPIQNIGAYGVEVKDVLTTVEAVEIATGRMKTFQNEACQFGYRDSIFKRSLKGKYFIVAITIRLAKNPVTHTSYGSIVAELGKTGISIPTIKDVSDAVIRIRQSKLPDPAKLGNAGSFFKNPIISKEQFASLLDRFPAIHHYPAGDAVKVPAAWLIEQCGLKGYRENGIGCHEKQPLVIINYEHRSGKEIFDFSRKIIDKVYDRFGIALEREVNVYP